MAFCMNCGKQLPNGAKFCLECGTKLGDTNAEQTTQRETTYEGKIYKCPNCGDILDAYESVCESCGYERRGSKATSSVQELARKLQEIEAQRPPKKIVSVFKQAMTQDQLSKTDEQKIDLIKNFAIPNTKEDIMEFAVLAVSNIDPDAFSSMNNTAVYDTSRKAVSNAWMAKFEQAYQKGKLMFGETPELQSLYQQYLEKKKAIKRKEASVWIMIAGIYGFIIVLTLSIMIGITISDNNSKAEEAARLETLTTQIASAIDNGDYKLALMYADRIRYNGSYDKELERDWEIQRDYWIDKIIDEAAKNGIALERPTDPTEEEPTEPIETTVTTKTTESSETTTPPETTNPTDPTEQNPTIQGPLHYVSVTIECKKNLIFSTYDVNFYIDGVLQGKIDHGTSKDFSLQLSEGTHILNFEKEGSNSVAGKAEIQITQAKNIICSISCTSSNVDVFVAENQITDPVDYSNNVIEKGSEYAYMSDEWNVYIASAISEKIIKVENWDKLLSSSKSVKYAYDVGTYKIDDPNTGFTWVDEEKTAFKIKLQDKNNSNGGMKKEKVVTFTINIDDSDKFKGTNYNDKIACYSFKNDDWHLYRAVLLTNSLVKIETWSRSSSLESFVYGYDVCVIDIDNGNTDFEWTDNDHTSFTITMQDAQNDYYWRKPILVAFELENERFTYTNTVEFLEG